MTNLDKAKKLLSQADALTDQAYQSSIAAMMDINAWRAVVTGLCLSFPKSPEDARKQIVARINKAESKSSPHNVVQPFQSRVRAWLLECFGIKISSDHTERNHRFLEESLELVQACGCTQSEAHQLVDYVYGRPVGERHQEVGGVVVTLAALCLAQELDMSACGEAELARIWTKVEQIRTKQAAKPAHSPLPQ